MIDKKNIPKGWAEVELGFFMKTGTGSVDPSKFKDEVFELYSIPVYDSGKPEIIKGEKIGSSKKIVSENDVLLSRIVPHIQRSWIVGPYQGYRQIGSGEWIIFDGTSINPKYLRYFLLSYNFHMKFMTTISGVGGSLTRANPNLTARFSILIPPLNEQNRIVEKLDELLSELEKGKEQLQTSLAQLKVYRQSILKHAFEGKLSEEWRRKQKKLKKSSELLDSINNYRKAIFENELNEFKKGKLKLKPKLPSIVTSQKESSSRNSSEIPSEWCRIQLKDLSEKITDGTHHTPEYKKEGIHFISVKDIYDGKVHFENTRFISENDHKELIKRCNPEEGDILITKSGTIGRLAIVSKEPQFSLFVSVALIKQYKSLLLDKYLLFILEDYVNSIDIKQDIKGGVIKNFHLEDLRIANIPYCSFEEQEFIVSEIETKLSHIQDLEKTINVGLLKSDSLKHGLLQKAFEGKLVEQDLEDEPSSILLERIKKEREEFLKAQKERKKTEKPHHIKSRKMAEELKRIIEILKERKEPVSAKTLWQSSTHKDDIDDFYATLKKHIESGEIIELPRKGKESFLKLADAK